MMDMFVANITDTFETPLVPGLVKGRNNRQGENS
jgi:hypothetical protein